MDFILLVEITGFVCVQDLSEVYTWFEEQIKAKVMKYFITINSCLQIIDKLWFAFGLLE